MLTDILKILGGALLPAVLWYLDPRWTAENRQFVDSAKPAISRATETSKFYFVPSSVRKSVCANRVIGKFVPDDPGSVRPHGHS